jgi:hypothetical protein
MVEDMHYRFYIRQVREIVLTALISVVEGKVNPVAN